MNRQKLCWATWKVSLRSRHISFINGLVVLLIFRREKVRNFCSLKIRFKMAGNQQAYNIAVFSELMSTFAVMEKTGSQSSLTFLVNWSNIQTLINEICTSRLFWEWNSQFVYICCACPSTQSWRNRGELWCNNSELWCNKSELWCNKSEFWCNKSEFWCNKSELWCKVSKD